MDKSKSISYKEIYCRIFSTIFYRIWLYRKRHYLITLIQIIMPPLILYVLVTIHASMFSTKQSINFTEYSRFSEKDLFKSICEPNCGKQLPTLISYVVLDKFPKQFETILEESSFAPWYSRSDFRFIKLKDEQEMLKLAVLHHIQDIRYIGGIVFRNNLNSLTFPVTENSSLEFNKSYELSVKIRLVKYIPSELSSFGSFNLDDSNIEFYLPFMGLQLGVFNAFLNYSHNGTFNNSYQLSVQNFPSPPHERYTFVAKENTYQFVSISLVLGITIVVYSLVRGPCSDQETKFKPYLHMMGLPRWSYWLCWILNDSLIQAIAVGIQVALLFLTINEDLGTLVKHGSPVIWTLFLLLYAMAAVSFITFLASFFKRGILATYIASTIWLLSYYFSDLFLPSYILAISWYAKLAMCLVPNAALIWGITLMGSHSGGISFTNIFSHLDENGISVFEIMIMLVIDIILYYTLTFCTDKAHPGLAPRKPWYTMFKRSCKCKHYCRCKKKKKSGSSVGALDADSVSSTEFFSSPLSRKDTVIQVEGLTKVYYNKTKAIDDVDYMVQVGKCATIVGHQGSGKSSMVHLLCGEVSPTHGKVKICGYDIRKDKLKVQSLVSVCLSENVICYDMTVFQHLLFIGKLKGMNHRKASEQATKYIQKLELTKKSHKLPEELLEYEKKKLCLMMAFMGNGKIVIIDEPTKKILEDDLKKLIWDFILSFHGDKTILVTTTSMEEGYYLGNRVSILSNGKIVASGTPQHLERLFGTGYHLKLIIKKGSDQKRIRDLIQYHAVTSTSLEPTSTRMYRALSFQTRQDDDRDNYEVDTAAKSSETSVYFDAEGEQDDISTIQMVDEILKIPKPPSTASSRLSSVASLITNVDEESDEIEILLPKSEAVNFAELFVLFENPNVMALLGILKWRILLYQIDKAFKEANEYAHMANTETKQMLVTTEYAIMSNLLDTVHEAQLTYIHRGWQRFKGLLIKRLMWIFGIKIYTLVQLLTPIVLLILTIQGTNQLFHNRLERSEHKITLRDYPSPTVIVRNISDDTNFTRIYEKTVRMNDKEVTVQSISTDFRAHIEGFGSDQDLLAVLSGQLISGLEVNDTQLTAMSSPLAFHAGPISLDALLNSYLKVIFPKGLVTMVVSSHPIENRTKEILKFYVPYDALIDGDDEILSYAVILGFGLFVLCSGFTIQPVAERVWFIKQLQLNTSLSFISYWVAFILWDWSLTVLVAGLLTLVIQNLPDHKAFADAEFGRAFFGFYVLAGYSSILISYNASFIFRRANTCYYGMLSYNQVAGMFAFIFAITLNFGPSINTIFRSILEILLQPFCVPAGFYSLITSAVENNKCELLSDTVKESICDVSFVAMYDLSLNRSNFNLSCCTAATKCESENCSKPHQKRYLQYDRCSSEELWYICAIILAQSLFLTIILLLRQAGISPKCLKRKMAEQHNKSSRHMHILSESSTEDTSVSLERINVQLLLDEAGPQERQNHLIINLTSTYTLNSRPVLSDVHLLCKPGEITTIFGPHGSGKTILMSILSKLRSCKNGKIYLNEQELLFGDRSEAEYFLSHLGYCPENVEKLYSKLTGLQLIKLFGRLRGIPESRLEFHTRKWLTLFGLTARANEDFKFYSESMKRKVFIILALIGDSQILLFDGPTKNLDPVSRYQFWTVIKHLVTKENRTVLITSTRANELEAGQCTKLVVLINGKVQYVMSPQIMMNNFGRGYIITISLKSKPLGVGFDDYINLKKRIDKNLVSSELQDEQQDLLRYSIPAKKKLKLSSIFRILEEIKYDFAKILGDYTVKETQLEDILHIMALKQIPNRIVTTTLDEFCLEFC